jgi:metal-dependent amidase/aminoacylase/carboxypeptidase family protein
MIAGKGPTAAIGAMFARRQANDDEARIGIAEGRHRQTVVARMLEFDGIQKCSQTRATPAGRIKCGVHTKGHKKRATWSSHVARHRSRLDLD